MTTDDEHKLDNYLLNKGKVDGEREKGICIIDLNHLKVLISIFSLEKHMHMRRGVVVGLRKKKEFNMSCFTMSRLSTQLKYYSLKITIFSPAFDAHRING